MCCFFVVAYCFQTANSSRWCSNTATTKVQFISSVLQCRATQIKPDKTPTKLGEGGSRQKGEKVKKKKKKKRWRKKVFKKWERENKRGKVQSFVFFTFIFFLFFLVWKENIFFQTLPQSFNFYLPSLSFYGLPPSYNIFDKTFDSNEIYLTDP